MPLIAALIALAALPAAHGPAQAPPAPTQTAPAGPLNALQVLRAVRGAMCRVLAGDHLSSGFVTPAGVMTSAHAVTIAPAVTIIFADGARYTTSVVRAFSKARDCVVFQLPPGDHHQALRFTTAVPAAEDALFLIETGVDQTVTQTHRAGIRKSGDRTFLEIATQFEARDPGCPIVDDHAQVRAVALGTAADASHASLAISAADAVAAWEGGVDLAQFGATEPPIPTNEVSNGLVGAQPFSLVVEAPDADLKAMGVTTEMIQGWVAEAIAAGAPRAKMITVQQQLDVAGKAPDALPFTTYDAIFTHLHVALEVIPDTPSAIYLGALEFQRGIATVNGRTTSHVWAKSNFGGLGGNKTPADQLRDVMRDITSAFCDAWNKANPAP